MKIFLLCCGLMFHPPNFLFTIPLDFNIEQAKIYYFADSNQRMELVVFVKINKVFTWKVNLSYIGFFQMVKLHYSPGFVCQLKSGLYYLFRYLLRGWLTRNPSERT